VGRGVGQGEERLHRPAGGVGRGVAEPFG
jgi:hypothetical protein